MAKSYLPRREAELVMWSTNFDATIQASATQRGIYGLTAEQAAQYHAAHALFVAAYHTANERRTRTPVTIAEKNARKRELIELARALVDIAQASPEMTDAKREALWITVRDSEPTPVPPPTVAPVVEVISVVGTRVRIRLHTGDPSSRARPEGVQGATVFSHVGGAAPSELGQYKFEGNTTRTSMDVIFDAGTEPGAKVWLTAFWYNRKGQSGPACPPVSTHLQGGGVVGGAGGAEAA